MKELKLKNTIDWIFIYNHENRLVARIGKQDFDTDQDAIDFAEDLVSSYNILMYQ